MLAATCYCSPSLDRRHRLPVGIACNVLRYIAISRLSLHQLKFPSLHRLAQSKLPSLSFSSLIAHDGISYEDSAAQADLTTFILGRSSR